MRDESRLPVFNRTNWQRKVRAPAWYRRGANEKRPAPETEPKGTEAS